MTSVRAPRDAETYVYDGNNHRVKITDANGTWYNVYNRAGLLLFQDNPTKNLTKENLYLQGHKLAQITMNDGAKTISYFFDDLLGSPVTVLLLKIVLPPIMII